VIQKIALDTKNRTESTDQPVWIMEDS